jgi:hypothetical protein
MTAPLVTLSTLDGVNLNPSSSFTSVPKHGHLGAQTADIDVATAARAEDGPAYAGTEFGARDFQVIHEVPDSSHETHLASLKALYPYPGKTSPSQTLVYVDRDGVTKRATVVLVKLSRLPTMERVERLKFEGTWRLLSPTSIIDSATSVAAVAKTSSPATLSATNSGNVPARTVVHTLKPTAAKSAGNGQRYRQQLTLLYKGDRPLARWPARVHQFNHAAEVTATRSMASGDDIELYVKGRRQMRWFGAHSSTVANQATTDVWALVDHPPARYWTYLGGSSLGSGATSMAVPKDSLQNMPALPFYGVFDDSGSEECVLVTGYDAKARTLTIARGQRGTTAATHASGKALYWAAWTADLVYGWTSAPAASLYVDDRYKPMCLSTSASASTNATWYFSNGVCEMATSGDPSILYPRGGGWEPRLAGPNERERATGKGDQYWLYSPKVSSNPSTIAGIEYIGRKYTGRLLADGWRFVSPIGISSFAMTYTISLGFGTDHEAGVAVWAVDKVGMPQRQITAAAALRFDDDIAGSGTETFTPTRSAYELLLLAEPWDPPADSAFVSASSEPTPASEPALLDSCEVTVTSVTFASAERLAFFASARQSIYQFGRPDAPATLASTLDTLYLDGLVCLIDETLSLDASARTITGTSPLPFRHWTRGPIPRLPAGTANLTFTETGIGTVEMGVSSIRSEWN